MDITVKGPSQLTLSISIDPSASIIDLKAAIAAASTTVDFPVERQRLIYSGKVLKDADLISVYKIQSGHTIHLIRSNPAPSASTAATNVSNVPASFATGQAAADPLTQLTRAQNAGALAGFNPFANMGTNINDPNMWGNLMQSDDFMRTMASSLQNPEVIEQMIAQHPEMSAMGPQMREMFQSDHFRQMIQNPEALRAMLQMQASMQGADGNISSNPFAAAMGGNSGQNTASPFTGGTDPAALQRMLAGLSSGGSANSPFRGSNMFAAPRPAAPVDSRSPEERFQTQLAQMQEMGLYDAARNIRALLATNGNIEAALEYIYSQPS